MIPHFVDPAEVSPIIPAEAAMIHAGSEVYASDTDSPVRFNLYAVPTSDAPGACGDISTGMSSWTWHSLKNVCNYVVDSGATLDLVSVYPEIPLRAYMVGRSECGTAVSFQLDESVMTLLFNDARRVYRVIDTYRRINSLSSTSWGKNLIVEVDGKPSLNCGRALSMAGKLMRPILSEVLSDGGVGSTPNKVNVVHLMSPTPGSSLHNQMHINIGSTWLLVRLLEGDPELWDSPAGVFGVLILDKHTFHGDELCNVTAVHSINDIVRHIVACAISEALG